MSTAAGRIVIPEVSRTGQKIGDKLNYSFTIKNSSAVPSINLSFKDPSQNQDILIVTQSVKTLQNELIYSAELIPFKTGAIVFPSFNINNIQVSSVRVTVNSILNPKTTPNLSEHYPPYQDYSDLILGATILIFILVFFLGWKNYQTAKALRETSLSPEQKHEVWEKVWRIFAEETPVDIKLYYFQSSEKLKEFVEKIIGLKITELTTRELDCFLKESTLAEKEAFLLAMSQADPVKFAKHFPESAEVKEYQSRARKFLAAHEPQREVADA